MVCAIVLALSLDLDSDSSCLAGTTLALLGASLSSKHAAYRNKKLLQGHVRDLKDASTPAGFQWRGLCTQFIRNSSSIEMT